MTGQRVVYTFGIRDNGTAISITSCLVFRHGCALIGDELCDSAASDHVHRKVPPFGDAVFRAWFRSCRNDLRLIQGQNVTDV